MTKINKSNEIQKNTITAILSASIVLGGVLFGKINLQNNIERLEGKVETLQIEKNILERENYKLQLDLIENGNPYGWELWGDSIGDWGYRKPNEYSIFGAVGDGYIYLREK